MLTRCENEELQAIRESLAKLDRTTVEENPTLATADLVSAVHTLAWHVDQLWKKLAE